MKSSHPQSAIFAAQPHNFPFSIFNSQFKKSDNSIKKNEKDFNYRKK